MKVVFAAVFTDINSEGALPEEVSIHKAEMTRKVALKMIHIKEDKRWVIHRLTELYAVH